MKGNILKKIRYLREYILRLLYPPKCIFCGKILDLNTKYEICRECYKGLKFIREPIISTNRIHPSGHAPFAQTRQSEEWNKRGCECVVCVFEYCGIIRESLMRFKFFDKPSYYRTLGLLLAEKIIEVAGNDENFVFDLILSVPLHVQRERQRGYNQARLIALCVSEATGVPYANDVIQRVVNTRPQSLLGKESRYSNISGAFEVVKPHIVKDKRIMIIDDIMTTGATLDECAMTLISAGAVKVFGGVIASGRDVSITAREKGDLYA